MKRIILTGASSGLGASIAQIFYEDGYEVVGICRSQPADFIKWIETDLIDVTSIKKASDSILENFPEFEVLVNCAGVLQVTSLDGIDVECAEALLKTNVLAPVILTSQLMSSIRQYGSDIVNIGSTVGFKAYESQTLYGASKWAIRGFNENLQLELKKTGSRVIGFNPWGFQSPIFEKATGEKVDLHAFMNPDDLAKLLLQILKLPRNMEVSEIIINRK